MLLSNYHKIKEKVIYIYIYMLLVNVYIKILKLLSIVIKYLQINMSITLIDITYIKINK